MQNSENWERGGFHSSCQSQFEENLGMSQVWGESFIYTYVKWLLHMFAEFWKRRISFELPILDSLRVVTWRIRMCDMTRCHVWCRILKTREEVDFIRVVPDTDDFGRNKCHGYHFCNALQRSATHCNALQHAATCCNMLQHAATCCSMLQHTATCCNMLQHCKKVQHTATYCNTL